MLYYVRVKSDRAKRRWKVREAKSVYHALNAIHMAMATGSIGGTDTVTRFPDNGPPGGMIEVLADVVRVNSDLTEAVPYGGSY